MIENKEQNGEGIVSADTLSAERKFFGRDFFALRQSPVTGVIVVMLFTLGIVLLPGESFGALLCGKSGTVAKNLGNGIFRIIGFTLLLLLALNIGYNPFDFKGSKKSYLLSLPFIIVAINNFPLIEYAFDKIQIIGSAAEYAAFTFNCVSVGLFEEVTFRGLVFLLVLEKTGDGFTGIIKAELISSALFGALHFVNLLSSPFLPVLAQVGYSFLIGCMCSCIYVLTKNVAACAFIHAVYNFGGLVSEELGTGRLWSVGGIALTAAIGVSAAAYWAYITFIYFKKTDLPAKIC